MFRRPGFLVARFAFESLTSAVRHERTGKSQSWPRFTWRELYASVLLPAHVEPEASQNPRSYLGQSSPPGGKYPHRLLCNNIGMRLSQPLVVSQLPDTSVSSTAAQ